MKPIKINVFKVDLDPLVKQLSIIADALTAMVWQEYGIRIREHTADESGELGSVEYHDDAENVLDELREAGISTPEQIAEYFATSRGEA